MKEIKQLEQIMRSIGEEHFQDELKTLEEIAMDKDRDLTEYEGIFPSQSYHLDESLIRARMKERNLTLKQLHEQVGVAYRTVTRWVSGQEFPHPQNLVRLAAVLELEPHELVIRTTLRKFDPTEDDLRFIQLQMEKVLGCILADENTSDDKKLEALLKAHNALIKARDS